MIEPVSDALTTSIRPACRAKNAMISSAMLPKVALRIPPTCGPVIDPSRSVDSPTTQASPRMAAADTTNRTVSLACRPKSRTIASRLRTTVPIRKARDSGDSWPRIGSPDGARWSSPNPIGPGRPVKALMRASSVHRVARSRPRRRPVQATTRQAGGYRDPPCGIAPGQAGRHELVDLAPGPRRGAAASSGRVRRRASDHAPTTIANSPRGRDPAVGSGGHRQLAERAARRSTRGAW